MANDLAKLQRSARDVSRWQKAQQQVVAERYGPARSTYRELLQRYPAVEQLWFELGLAVLGEIDFSTAEDAFSRAQRLALNDSAFQVLLGQQFHRLRRPALARACFERAVVADPGSIHAQLSLAAWCEREHRLSKAQEAVEACLSRQPKNAQALCVKAQLLHRQNRNAEAETLLREVIAQNPSDTNVRISARHWLGVVLDRLGQYDEALRFLQESKSLLRQTANVTRMEEDYDRADRFRRELLSGLTREMICRWREEQPIETGHRLALLAGHPRSGTTLLEQILGAHSSILAIDESEAFVQEVWHRLAPMQATQPLALDQLNRLNAPDRARMRERYLRSVLREIDGELGQRILLDKNPSPTAALHLWLRLMPETKIIIALRDPRDVVISSFFQSLMLTPANANFLTLERTAKHYADLMDVWLRMRDLGGFDWIESRYEDLVENPSAEGRRVTGFCGLEWQPAQQDHESAARNKVVFSPTFTDVAQPVHKRALGRWHHYARALEPCLKPLARFCNEFGYPA